MTGCCTPQNILKSIYSKSKMCAPISVSAILGYVTTIKIHQEPKVTGSGIDRGWTLSAPGFQLSAFSSLSSYISSYILSIDGHGFSVQLTSLKLDLFVCFLSFPIIDRQILARQRWYLPNLPSLQKGRGDHFQTPPIYCHFQTTRTWKTYHIWPTGAAYRAHKAPESFPRTGFREGFQGQSWTMCKRLHAR